MSWNGSNSPTGLDVNNFRSALDSLGQVAKSCRFAVTITPVQGSQGNLLNALSYRSELPKMIYVCDVAEFPGRGFNVSETRYYGPAQVFPNNTVYQPANFSFICRTKSLERQFFDDYQDIVNPINTYNFRFPDKYFTQVDIYQFAEYGVSKESKDPQVIYSWRLNRAWPMLVSPQPVTWADQDILRLNVTFAYKWWDRPGDTENFND